MENYKELATRTECEYSDALLERAKENVRLLHAVLGLSGEISELRAAIAKDDKVNILEEIGDMYWYLAIIENMRNINFAPGENVVEASAYDLVDDLEYFVGQLTDGLKKSIFYGKEFLDGDVIMHADDVALSLCSLVNLYDGSVANVKETNINKLKARYGEKFSEDMAINRDLVKESSVLEENLNG